MILLALLLALIPPPLAAQDAGGELRPPDSARFVASSRGSVYYPVACEAWRGLSPGTVLFFRSAEIAEERGYTPTRNRACAEATPLPTADLRGRRVGACVVESVIDGDTVTCRGGVRIRLLLIDAPETAQSDFGLRARLALEEMLPVGDTSAVELDVEERDRYGRVLSHLHASDGTWVNRAMVRRGYAVPLVYPPNVRHVETIRAAADSARMERRGLWARGAFECRPVDFRAGRCGG